MKNASFASVWRFVINSRFCLPNANSLVVLTTTFSTASRITPRSKSTSIQSIIPALTANALIRSSSSSAQRWTSKPISFKSTVQRCPARTERTQCVFKPTSPLMMPIRKRVVVDEVAITVVEEAENRHPAVHRPRPGHREEVDDRTSVDT